MPNLPPTITTAELHRLLVQADQLWLIYVPDTSAVTSGHIPGSLATSDEALLTALAVETPMVLYGDDAHSTAVRALAARLASRGSNVRWYVGGLEAWIAADHPVEGA